jgi:hypothetical protein
MTAPSKDISPSPVKKRILTLTNPKKQYLALVNPKNRDPIQKQPRFLTYQRKLKPKQNA